MAADDYMRIGDAERERAVARLQDHLAAGRLSAEEFDERMGKALEARTAADLSTLFHDLPGGEAAHQPGQPTGYGSASDYVQREGYSPYDDLYPLTGQAASENQPSPYYGDPESGGLEPTQPYRPNPWYAQWWILLIAVFMGGIADGRLWFLIPATAIWIWVVYPNLTKRRETRQQVSGPPRPMTYLERDQVILTLQSSGEVAAIRRYRELTGADLYTATMTVRAINRELGA